MRPSRCLEDDPCCSVLPALQLLNTACWSSMQHRVAVETVSDCTPVWLRVRSSVDAGCDGWLGSGSCMLEPQSGCGCRMTDDGPGPRQGPSSHLKQWGRRLRQILTTQWTRQLAAGCLSRPPEPRTCQDRWSHGIRQYLFSLSLYVFWTDNIFRFVCAAAYWFDGFCYWQAAVRSSGELAAIKVIRLESRTCVWVTHTF